MKRWTLTFEGLEPFTIPALDLIAASHDAMSAREYMGNALLSVVMVEEVASPLTSGLEKLTNLGFTEDEARAIAGVPTLAPSDQPAP